MKIKRAEEQKETLYFYGEFFTRGNSILPRSTSSANVT